jgi:hypothetical protein
MEPENRIRTRHWLTNKRIKELRSLYKADPAEPLHEFGGIVLTQAPPPDPDDQQEADEWQNRPVIIAEKDGEVD